MRLQRISLLVVEDERPLALLWASELGELVDATLAHSLREARQKLRGRGFEAILLDLHLPDGNGLDLLRELAARRDETPVIILTGNADLDSAIQAVRLGAHDYLIKPCKLSDLEQRLQLVAREHQLRNENVALRQQLTQQAPGQGFELVGDGPALAEVRRLLARAAPTDASILIQGETGTGKEVVARLIHATSLRREAAFVPINCAALPRDLAESELFGHRRGAFTGADRDHRGLVQAAAGGTLFLDEIADLSPEVQAKFLRLLESREGRRVGDTDPYKADVRVVAATNRDLRQDVAGGRFRQDLFYRLATFELKLPGLRQIIDDLPAIARHLLGTTPVPGATARRLSPAALSALRDYDWPGNVRELRNVLERAKILCEHEEILPEHLSLPASLVPPRTPLVPSGPPPEGTAQGNAQGTTQGTAQGPMHGTLDDMEGRMIQAALRDHNGNKTAAARALGISLRTLYNKLEAKEKKVDR